MLVLFCDILLWMQAPFILQLYNLEEGYICPPDPRWLRFLLREQEGEWGGNIQSFKALTWKDHKAQTTLSVVSHWPQLVTCLSQLQRRIRNVFILYAGSPHVQIFFIMDKGMNRYWGKTSNLSPIVVTLYQWLFKGLSHDFWGALQKKESFSPFSFPQCLSPTYNRCSVVFCQIVVF